MFPCHLCSKSFPDKAGLTQNNTGKKHLENTSAPEIVDALESAALAQRQKLSAEAASTAEATRVAQHAYEVAALAQRQKLPAASAVEEA